MTTRPPAVAPPVSDKRFIAGSVLALLSGRFGKQISHLPVPGSEVPEDFLGICIAPFADPESNDRMLDWLDELAVRQVRMDYTYHSVGTDADRFIRKLHERGFKICLDLVQPFEEASKMKEEPAQLRWREFVEQVCRDFSDCLEIIEVGSTINRRRWAGYSVQGFLNAWLIAHQVIRDQGVRLAGANVTDFEPMYNAGLLAWMQKHNCLPDIHTDNLFVERATQPERYDQKIAGERLAPLFRFNLIKKARLLQSIGARYGVSETWCTHTTWTAPRIRRIIDDADQKQADYLSRYYLLAAASGALSRVYWGALVCRSAGLIDDCTGEYPNHERVTLYDVSYGNADGCLRRPAFRAMQALAQLLPGMRYEGKLADQPGLEAHAFVGNGVRLHALWTMNGKVASLASLYPAAQLAAAEGLSRDGDKLTETPEVITEAPLFLRWPSDVAVDFRPDAGLLEGVALHCHEPDARHYVYEEGEFRGMLLARDQAERDRFLAGLGPAQLEQQQPEGFLRRARNAIWSTDDPRGTGGLLVIKRPVRLRPHKKIYERFRPAKSLQSWNGANELLRRGIETPRPVAYFECRGENRLTRNYYICEFMPGGLSVRKFFSAYAAGDTEFEGVSADEMYQQLSEFVVKMHNRGVYFRDLSSGNILVRRCDDGGLAFSLVDTGRARFYTRGANLYKRLSDLKRLCFKLDWAGRNAFMEQYMQVWGREFLAWHRIPFHFYDLKIRIKRFLRR